ncbi:MAG TPA: DUF2723 domain-containing protein [Candidatus Polarisedimenticolaceae bacterium]|nr:DUF2723 domain-containing protein [Candidatus Polarisedimenticolaceae bacterium]
MLHGSHSRGESPAAGGARLSDRRLAASVFFGALLVYALTAARTITFGDSGELIAASWRFGIAHPPGYPLYTLLLGAVLHALPIGEPALRTTLMSAVTAAAASAVVAVSARAIAGSTLSGIAAAGIFATSSVVWSTATETEVYAAHALLLALLLETSRRGRLLGAAVALGLGLAHHPTIVLALPSAAMLAWPALRTSRPRTLVLAAAIALSIPLAADATLLLRGRSDPGAWGGVDSVPSLVAHVTAARYRSYDLGFAGLLRPEGWSFVAATLGRGLAFTGLLAACAGAARMPRRERNAFLILAAAGIVFALRYATEDVDVFLLPAVLGLSLLAASAVPKRAGLAVTIGLIAFPLALNLRGADRHADRAAWLYASDMLATLPRGSTLFVDGDDAFVLAYATQVRGQRADLILVDRRGLLFSSARFYGGGAGEQERMAREIAEAERASNPVLFMGWPGYELPSGLRFEPEGLFFRVRRSDELPVDTAPLWSGYHETEIALEAAKRPGAFASAVAATYPLMRAEEALARGRADVAVREMDEALRRAPRSETILNTIGTTWARRGNLVQAVAAFEKAVAAKPQSLRGWLNLAQARALSGDRNGAEQAGAKARALAGAGR